LPREGLPLFAGFGVVGDKARRATDRLTTAIPTFAALHKALSPASV